MKIGMYNIVRNDENIELNKLYDIDIDCKNNTNNIEFFIHKICKILNLNKLTLESKYIIAFDAYNIPIGICNIAIGMYNKVEYERKIMAQFLLLIDAFGFVDIHNHPYSNNGPGKYDILESFSTKSIADLLEINLHGSYVVTDNDIIKY